MWVPGSYKHDNKPSDIDTPGKSFTPSENFQGLENKLIVVSYVTVAVVVMKWSPPPPFLRELISHFRDTEHQLDNNGNNNEMFSSPVDWSLSLTVAKPYYSFYEWHFHSSPPKYHDLNGQLKSRCIEYAPCITLFQQIYEIRCQNKHWNFLFLLDADIFQSVCRYIKRTTAAFQWQESSSWLFVWCVWII